MTRKYRDLQGMKRKRLLAQLKKLGLPLMGTTKELERRLKGKK